MTSDRSPFDRRVVIAIVVAGVLAFAAFLWLSAYAPAVRSFDTTGFAPLSKNAVGFAGTFKLIEDVTGEEVEVLEDDQAYDEPGLLILPLAIDTDPAALRAFVTQRADNVERGSTLLILPKWDTRPIPSWSSDWVQSAGLSDWNRKEALVEQLADAKIFIDSRPGARIRGLPGVDLPVPPEATAVLADASSMSLLRVDEWRSVLVRLPGIEGAPVYLLTDPDLFSNHALKTAAGAQAAMAIVAAVRPTERAISTDPEPARGSTAKPERNLLQLMFEPPFLAITLAILAAALLAALNAFGRFGPAQAEARAIPMGSRALADNTAILFERAGAVGRLGERYVALTRDAAAQALGAKHLAPADLERWLARLPRAKGPDFATLAADLRGARDAGGVRAGAAALHDWKDEVTGGR